MDPFHLTVEAKKMHKFAKKMAAGKKITAKDLKGLKDANQFMLYRSE
jgi:hypothetical protein